MADIALTAARVEPIDPMFAEIYSLKAEEAITQGQVVYMTSTGTVGVADANAAGKQQAKGVALSGVAAGQMVDVLVRGRVAGFTVSGVNCAAILYLSDTAGAMADAAGTMTVPCGVVMAMTDKSATRVFFANFRWRTAWA